MWFTSVFFWLWDRMEGKVLLILAQCLDGDHSCLTACSGAQSLLEVVISSFFLTCMVMKTYYYLPHLEWRVSKLGFCSAKYRRFSFPRKRWVFWTWENNSAPLHLGLPTSLAGVGTRPRGWVHRRGLGRGGYHTAFMEDKESALCGEGGDVHGFGFCSSNSRSTGYKVYHKFSLVNLW